MKKSLLATTALAALGVVAVASPASAKFEVGVSGYMEQWFGYSDNKETVNANSDVFDMISDNEFNIDFKQTLDNGLEIGGQIQVEGQQAGGETDEQFIFMNGSFGRIELGTDNGAAYRMHYGVASNGIGIDESDWTSWIPGTSTESRATSIGSGIENDQNKVTYFSPRLNGIQIGATYIPEMDVNLSSPSTAGKEADGVRDNAFSIAANYVNSFDAVSLSASIGYTDAGSGVQGDHTGLNAGLRIGFGGFTASLAYGEEDDQTVNNVDEVSILGVGLGYKAGPAGVSIAYIRGEDSFDNFKQNAIEVGASYVMGPGVTAKGSLYYADSKTAGANTADGVAVVGGLALSF
jgi:outer membrane protein OmpU